MHHWSDVLSGAILGTAISLLDVSIKLAFLSRMVDTKGSCLRRRRPRCHTFGFRLITLEGCFNFIQTLQKGQASLNTGQVSKGDNLQNLD